MDFQTPRPRTPSKAGGGAGGMMGGGGQSLTRAEKTRLLENLDMEVYDRTRAFESALSEILSSFLLRQETELMKIPKEIRNLKMRELKEMWGGDWGATLKGLKEKTVGGRGGGEGSGRVGREGENGLERVVADMKKRKRDDAASVFSDLDPGPSRKMIRRADNPSNAKTAPSTPSSKPLKPKTPHSRPFLPTSTSFSKSIQSPFKRLVSRTKINANGSPIPPTPPPKPKFANGNGYKQPGQEMRANYPAPTPQQQQHQPHPLSRNTFQPRLPSATPQFPRQMRETDVVFTANGSPIANPWNGAGVGATPGGMATPSAASGSGKGMGPLRDGNGNGNGKGKGRAEADSEDEPDDDLPDAEALEREMLAASTSRPAPRTTREQQTEQRMQMLINGNGAGRGKKRISSIRIRQSVTSKMFGQGTGLYDPFIGGGGGATPKPVHKLPAKATTPQQPFPPAESTSSPAKISNRGANIRVTTASGLEIDFDPLEDDPERIQEELKENGVDEEVREQVREEVRKRVNALRERLAKFKL